MRDLWLKLIGEFGGFVLENEPTGETYGRSMCAVGRPAHNMGAAWL